MNKLRSCFILFALCATPALAQPADPRAVDPRTARVIDRSDAESQVSAVTVSNEDERFGFNWSEHRGRMVVETANVAWAIPLHSVNSVIQNSRGVWTVKYQTKDGETSVQGSFSEGAELLGDSDFGTFNLPLIRLKRLEFGAPGTPPEPAKRPNVFDRDGKVRSASFDGVITLTDGTELAASLVHRNQVYAESTADPLVIATTAPTYAVVVTNYTDLRLLRGETLQTIPFEKIITAEFLPGDAVLVKTKSGAEAEMNMPRQDERSLEGFTGFTDKGDFYIPVKYIKKITFADTASR